MTWRCAHGRTWAAPPYVSAPSGLRSAAHRGLHHLQTCLAWRSARQRPHAAVSKVAPRARGSAAAPAWPATPQMTGERSERPRLCRRKVSPSAQLRAHLVRPPPAPSHASLAPARRRRCRRGPHRYRKPAAAAAAGGSPRPPPLAARHPSGRPLPLARGPLRQLALVTHMPAPPPSLPPALSNRAPSLQQSQPGCTAWRRPKPAACCWPPPSRRSSWGPTSGRWGMGGGAVKVGSTATAAFESVYLSCSPCLCACPCPDLTRRRWCCWCSTARAAALAWCSTAPHRSAWGWGAARTAWRCQQRCVPLLRTAAACTCPAVLVALCLLLLPPLLLHCRM